jgi:hypothetical protein
MAFASQLQLWHWSTPSNYRDGTLSAANTAYPNQPGYRLPARRVSFYRRAASSVGDLPADPEPQGGLFTPRRLQGKSPSRMIRVRRVKAYTAGLAITVRYQFGQKSSSNRSLTLPHIPQPFRPGFASLCCTLDVQDLLILSRTRENRDSKERGKKANLTKFYRDLVMG